MTSFKEQMRAVREEITPDIAQTRPEWQQLLVRYWGNNEYPFAYDLFKLPWVMKWLQYRGHHIGVDKVANMVKELGAKKRKKNKTHWWIRRNEHIWEEKTEREVSAALKKIEETHRFATRPTRSLKGAPRDAQGRLVKAAKETPQE